MADSKEKYSRRQWLQKTLVMGGAAISSSEVLARACSITLPQGEGPYYPQSDLNRDNDLTQFRPGARPEGYPIILAGAIQDGGCTPVEGALIEIWQASARGRYNHTEDPNKNVPLDPNFQYWGRTTTGQKGRFVFKTIIPGHYSVGGGRFRPPHIHVKIHARNFYSLTTQVYFDPSSYDDLKLRETVRRLNDLEQVPEALKISYRNYPHLDPGVKMGRFNFTIQRN